MTLYRTALVMIARDESARIAAALASARPHVDELVVMDTGSSDATVELARAVGARVARFPWCDDFAAARNAALAFADADWNVVMDADEQVAAEAPALLELRHTAPTFVGLLRVDSRFDTSTGVATAPSWLARVLPRGVRYEGVVHEQPVHRLPLRQLPTVLAHDGYRDAALACKAGRNARLLAEAVRQRPDDPYLHYQLGKDHDVYERYAEAALAFARSRELDGSATLHTAGVRNSTPAWHHDRLLREMHALKKCGAHVEAIHLADAALGQWPDSPDFFFALGDLLLDYAAEEPVQADALLPMVEAAWLRCLEIGERPELEGAVCGRGSSLAARNLAILYEGTGRPDEARRLRSAAA